MVTFDLFIEQTLNGIQLGMMLFLMSIGVTLVFGVMRVINLAHGAMLTLAASVAARVYTATDSLLLSVLIAMAGCVVGAIAIEYLVVRKLYTKSHLDQVLATFGITLFINELVIVLFGREPLFMSVPSMLSGQIEILPGIIYPAYRLVITGASVAIGLVLYLLLTRTRVGALVRAGADDRQMVALLGSNIDRVYTIVFVLSAVLAAVAGIMIGPLISIQSGLGDPILILALVVIVIGGLGSVHGALVASVLVGCLDTAGRILLPQLLGSTAGAAIANMMVYLVMAAVLLVRPQGLFGMRS